MGAFFTNNLSMIKTYEIDLDDTLVDSASKIFEALGTDVDAAISIFLNQAVLRKGFPFDVVIPEADDVDGTIEETPAAETQEESAEPVAENLSADDTIEETSVAPEEVTNPAEEKRAPEEDGDSAEEESAPDAEETSDAVPSISPEVAARVAANETLVAQMKDEIGDRIVTPEFDENEDDGTHGDYDSTPAAEKKESEYEDEDEETPENLFAAWGTR